MNTCEPQNIERTTLQEHYRAVRARSKSICKPLYVDDYQIQSIVETSPPKWHLAHVSWFFETFLLNPFRKTYTPFHPRFQYLFNSYYETVGSVQPRAQRGLLSRPTVQEVYSYRAYVDEQMHALIEQVSESDWALFAFRVVLGLNHEQQHQELLLMDIKHNFATNPLQPAYRKDLAGGANLADTPTAGWVEIEGGDHQIGHATPGFAYDNEMPRHRVLLQDHRLATRKVTNQEYLAFIKDGGYQEARHWLADGWSAVREHKWYAPCYWQQLDDVWFEMTLGGLSTLDLSSPVCHISYYEADAYTRWAGKRLPNEAELEVALAQRPIDGNFAESDTLQPVAPTNGEQWYGDVWEWTSSPYTSYPGFRPLAGSVGEYNGKFMCNQYTLKGGCCVTAANHIRASYRNFFYPRDRWPFTGIRLAENV